MRLTPYPGYSHEPDCQQTQIWAGKWMWDKACTFAGSPPATDPVLLADAGDVNPIVPVAVGAGILVVALLGGLVWNHIIYGDWKCAFRHCVVAPGWHEP